MASPNQINLFSRVKLPINAEITGPTFEFGIAGRTMYDYTWIFGAGVVFAFIVAAGSGSNDVANSWATSVGARSLKMWQAVVLACIMEFSGAMLLGQRTTATIRSNIVLPSAFVGHEDLLMMGMLTALSFTGFWLLAASHYEVNVSTTHSLIGAIIGFSLCCPVAAGGVNWGEVGRIVGSWFASPVLSGLISGSIFWVTRRFILRSENGYERTLVYFPILTFLTMFVNAYYIATGSGITAGRGLSRLRITDGEAAGACIVIAFICALFVHFVIVRYLRRYVGSLSDDDLDRIMTGGIKIPDLDAVKDGSVVPAETQVDKSKASLLDRMFHQEYIHSSIRTDTTVQSIHRNAESFPIRTEFTFGYLQIMTACFASFAHGSNDVANYVGPLAAIYGIYRNQSIASSSRVDDWLLAVGGAGLLFGLAVYGHVLIAACGVKMAKITPSRGYAIELAAAIIIITASYLSIPISSSHSFVGAIVGVALMESDKRNSWNVKILVKNVIWWLCTLIFCGVTSAAIFSWSTFSPSQVYPLSASNCMFYYATTRNTSRGDPASYQVNVNSAGTLRGIYGYPSTGMVYVI